MSWRWVIKLALILLTHVGALVLLWRGIAAASAWQVVAGVIVGHLVLDTVTLLVHWFLDNYLSPTTPVIGTVVHYFREHHERPLAMFGRGYVDNNFENALIGLAFELGTLALAPGVIVDICFGWASIGACYITLIHKWAHIDDPGPLARTLQRLHLIVDRRHHDRHHALLGTHYGLYAGWVDPLFEATGALALIERTIELMTGVAPLTPQRRRR